MARSAGDPPRAIENDALIETSFRRLLAAIESERERIRESWQKLEEDKGETSQDLERLRVDTEDWCYRERQKIEAEWGRLDALNDRMAVLLPAGKVPEMVEIKCSGRLFCLPRSTLRLIEESKLSQLFSDAFSDRIPRDAEGRFLLDFNPVCFGLVVDHLRNMRLKPDAPPPVVPMEQQASMHLLAEELNLTPFLRRNRVTPINNTSLVVTGNTIRASHGGWQVISSEHPLTTSSDAYFQVNVVANPNPKGGLAVGLCDHVPRDTEIHSIRLPSSALYNSSNGLVGDLFVPDDEDVKKSIQLIEGSSIGIRHDIRTRTLVWFYNRKPIGSCRLRPEMLEKTRVLYPVFALYVPNQKIDIDFTVRSPEVKEPRAMSVETRS